MGNSLGRFKVSRPKPPEKSKRGHRRSLSVAPLNDWFQTRRMSEMEVVKKKGFIRVKVVLSKEEAARLLALCARHRESMAIKTERRLGTLQTPRRRRSYRRWRPVLASIPELI